jgi:beta-aspartyl-dipeptidase (metallo-type)
MYFEEMWSLETILPLVTTTPAAYYKLSSKGKIEAGKDADILVLDRATLDLKQVIGKGQFLKTLEWTKKGMFES